MVQAAPVECWLLQAVALLAGKAPAHCCCSCAWPSMFFRHRRSRGNLVAVAYTGSGMHGTASCSHERLTPVLAA